MHCSIYSCNSGGSRAEGLVGSQELRRQTLMAQSRGWGSRGHAPEGNFDKYNENGAF